MTFDDFVKSINFLKFIDECCESQYNLRMTVRELRKQLNLTQTEFGALFGIPLGTIQNWEYGRYKAPDYVVNMMVEILEFRGLIPAKRK